MAVPEQLPIVSYVANGATDHFNITFDLSDEHFLVVTVNNEIPPVGTFTVQDNDVIFHIMPEAGTIITLARDTDLERETNYSRYDNSFNPAALNWDLDKLWHVLQEQNLVDAKILARIKSEIEWRRTHDFNYDELAQVREKQQFDALKSYSEALLASANPGVFQGVIAGVVFARDGKSIQTHLEEILESLVQERESIKLKAAKTYVDEQLLNKQEQIDSKAPLAVTDTLQQQKVDKVYFDNTLSSFQNGAVKAYPTLAAANADIANIALNTKVSVLSATEGGDYYKASADATSLTKSPWDVYQQSVNFANSNGLFRPINLTTANWIAVDQLKTSGWYIVTSATVATSMGLPEPAAGILLVISNSSQGLIHQKWMPFNSSKEYTRISNVSGVFPAFQKLATNNEVTAQLQQALLAYLPTSEITKYTTKPYDIIRTSKNLFDKKLVQDGKYLNNTGGILAAAGWGMSNMLPVEPNQTYTLSGTRARIGLAFYVNESDTSPISGSYDGTATLPLTVTAPATAKYVAFNLYTASNQAYSNIQLEKGSVATSYEEAGIIYQIDAAYLNTAANSSKYNVKIAGSAATINGVVDGIPISIDVSLTKENTHSQSTVFNFAKDTVNNIIQRSNSDDVAPMRMDGTTVGANHGYQKSNLTLVAHGKTTADIGSVWLSGGKQYVIVDIVSADVLSVTSRNDNSTFALAELTHVSGATNTASFTPTVTVSAQWYPAIRDRKLTCFVDDSAVDLSKNGTYEFKKTVKFLESYSIMKKLDIVEWLIVNKGQNYVNYNAVPAYTVNFGYTFDHECGCTIYFGGVGRKTFDLTDQMITQSIQLAQGNGTVYNYIPKAVQFTDVGFTYNFSKLENLYSKNPSDPIYLTAARQESGTNPIDRIIMLNDQVGYATGYLPILDAAPNVRPTKASRKYLEIRNGTLKIYPRLIDSESFNRVNKGDTFEAIAYRVYFLRDPNCTAKYTVRSNYGDFFFLHWHTFSEHEVELPADLVGREFEIVEQSSNVDLISNFASHSIIVDVTNTRADGYLVLKFK